MAHVWIRVQLILEKENATVSGVSYSGMADVKDAFQGLASWAQGQVPKLCTIPGFWAPTALF